MQGVLDPMGDFKVFIGTFFQLQAFRPVLVGGGGNILTSSDVKGKALTITKIFDGGFDIFLTTLTSL